MSYSIIHEVEDFKRTVGISLQVSNVWSATLLISFLGVSKMLMAGLPEGNVGILFVNNH